MATATAKRTPIQQRLYDEGLADATAGRPATPPGTGAVLDKAYTDGYGSVTPPASSKKGPTAPKPSGTAGTPTRARRHAPPRGRARARRTPVSYRRASRALTAPVNNQLASGMTTIGLMIALAVLFNLLRNAQAVGGVITAVGKAVDWLDSPRSITYRPN